MGWLSKAKTVRALDAVGQGADVEIEVVVASPDAIESTTAPIRAAAFRWALLTERTGHGGGKGGGGTTRALDPFAGGWRGGPLVVRAPCGRTIEISLDHAQLSAPVDPEDGVPLGESPRSAQTYAAVLARAPAGSGVVYVREHAITHGQRLVLRARLEPTLSASSYRDAASTTTAAFRSTGEITIEDRSLDL